MRLEKYITESLDKPYPFKITVMKMSVMTEYRAEFMTKGKTDVRMTARNHGGDVLIEFTSIGSDGVRSFSLTNEQDAFRVMATVVVFVKKVIDMVEADEDEELEYVYFTADKEDDDTMEKTGRAKLYKRLINRYIDKKAWKIEITDHKSKVDFKLVKK